VITSHNFKIKRDEDMSQSEVEKYRATLERDPTDTQAFVNLCRIAEQENDYEYLGQLYKYRAQVIKDTQEIADLFFNAGEIYADKMNDLARGVEAFLQGFEFDPGHAGIGDRLDAIYREAEDWEAAIHILEQRLEALGKKDTQGTNVVIRSDLHQQAGEVWDRVYSNRERALEHYRKAIELDKTNLLALYGAREIYYQAGKYKNAAKLCELEARAEKDIERRIALYRELAHLLREHLSDPPQAVLALKRALKLSPESSEVKLDLARTVALTDISEDNKKDHRWASDYLLRAAREMSPAESLDLAKLALMALPENAAAVEFIESRAKEVGAPDELAEAYKTIIERKASLEDQAPLIRRLAKVYVEEIGSPEEALEWLKKIEPLGMHEDKRAIQQLSKGVKVRASQPPPPTAERTQPKEAVSRDEDEEEPIEDGAAEELVTVPPEAVALTSEPDLTPEPKPARGPEPEPKPRTQRAPLKADGPSSPPEGMSEDEYITSLHKAAEKARRSGDDETAEERMMAVLEFKPHDQKATTYLERRFRARGDWLSLRDLLLRSAGAPHLPQAVQTVRLREAARISEEQLGDTDGAIAAWKLIRQNDPKVRDAGDALSRLLGEAERWDELLEVIEEEAATTKSRAKRIEAYRRMADINRIRLGNVEAAMGAFKKVLSLNPEDPEAMEALDEIYLREQLWEDLVPLLRKRAELSRDRTEKRNLLLRSATMLRERMDRAEEAYAQAKEILAISANDDEVLEMMESIDEEGEHWGRLLNTLDLRVRAASSNDDKAGFLHKKAMIATHKFQDTTAAVKALKEVLAILPEDLSAIDQLTDIYTTGGQWEDLVELLKERINITEDEHEQADIHRQLARILEDELDRVGEAMKSWRRVLEIEEDVESLGALSRYYERKEDWGEFVDVLERQAPYAEAYSERADIMFRRAEILWEKLGEQDKAASELKKILDEVDPTHVKTMNLLCDVHVREGDYKSAADILEQQIAHTEDRSDLKQLYVKLGDWSRSELDDLRRSMEAYERAVRLDPDDDSLLGVLDELYTSLEEWDNLLNLIHERFQRSQDSEYKLELLVRGAKLCEEKLEDNARSWTWYRLAFANLRDVKSTIDVVDEAARRMGLWQELIEEVYGVMTRIAGEAGEQVIWWMKIAEIFEEKIEDSDQALEAVLRAFGLKPENKDLLDAVDRLAVAAKNWQRLSTVYGVLVNRTGDKTEKTELLIRYAELLMEQEDQKSQAFDVVLKAFELDPKSDKLLELTEQIGEAADRWEDLVRVYNVCAKLANDPLKKAELKMRSVIVFRDKMEDTDRALQNALEVFRIDPFNEEISSKVWTEIGNLEDDLLTTEKGTYWMKMVELCRELADMYRKERERQVDLLLVVARVYLEELQDVPAAFECLKEIQQLNPRDEDVIDKLEKLAGEHNFWEAVTEHYQDVLDETFEMEIAVMLHRRRARILEEELKRPDEAAEHYWQIIQLDATDRTGYEKLLSYYERAGKWNELVNMLERQLDNTSEEEDKKKILLHIASIWENEIGNRYEAKDWYEQVITIWPNEKEALEGLRRLTEGRVQAAAEEEEEDDEDIRSLISIPPPEEMEIEEFDEAETQRAVSIEEGAEEEAEPEDESASAEEPESYEESAAEEPKSYEESAAEEPSSAEEPESYEESAAEEPSSAEEEDEPNQDEEMDADDLVVGEETIDEEGSEEIPELDLDLDEIEEEDASSLADLDEDDK
jgi:tetratricopeptide (TPR) repeat protein